MNKKLIGIIAGLFLIQVAVYSITHIWNKNQEVLEKIANNPYRLNPDGSLNLENQNLIRFPKEILELEGLKIIYLGNNRLYAFPYELLKMPNIQEIHFENNQLGRVNFSHTNSTSLLVLNLHQNKLKAIKGLEGLTALSHLDLSDNALSTTPELNIPSLIKVNLSANFLDSFNIERINPQLKILDLSSNYLTKFKIKDTLFRELNELNLKSNDFEEVPTDIFKLSDLYKLNMINCKLKSFNPKVIAHENLKILRLNKNNIIDFNLNLEAAFPYLKILELNNNLMKNMQFNHNDLVELSIQKNPDIDINITANNLKKLYIDNGDAQKKSVIKAPNLEQIYLRNGTQITSEHLTKQVIKAPYAKISYMN